MPASLRGWPQPSCTYPLCHTSLNSMYRGNTTLTPPLPLFNRGAVKRDTPLQHPPNPHPRTPAHSPPSSHTPTTVQPPPHAWYVGHPPPPPLTTPPYLDTYSHPFQAPPPKTNPTTPPDFPFCTLLLTQLPPTLSCPCSTRQTTSKYPKNDPFSHPLLYPLDTPPQN
jgi:hypothetical protein